MGYNEHKLFTRSKYYYQNNLSLFHLQADLGGDAGKRLEQEENSAVNADRPDKIEPVEGAHL